MTTTDGTGVVHTAVMYGEDDYALGKKIGLPEHHTVDEEGKFTKRGTGLAGKYVKSKETEEKIFKNLQAHGNLLRIEKYMCTNIRTAGAAARRFYITRARRGSSRCPNFAASC